MPQIGEIKWSNEIGRKGHHRHMWKACPKCSTERWVEIRKDTSGRNIICRSCAGKNLPHSHTVGRKHGMWNGGRHINWNGYFLVWLDKQDPFHPMASVQNYVFEHRLVMAKHMGRLLKRGEYVHHKNGIKIDNRIENLELAGSLSQHMKEHFGGYTDGFEKGYRDGLARARKELREVSFS